MAAFPEAEQQAPRKRKKGVAFPEADETPTAPVVAHADSGEGGSFLGGLSQLPGEMVRTVLPALSPSFQGGFIAQSTVNRALAGTGDSEAQDRVRAQQLVADIVGAALPGGPALRAGPGLAAAIGRRALIGAGTGALTGGAQAALEGSDVPTGAGTGAVAGTVGNVAFGGLESAVQAIIQKRLARRLAEMELETAGAKATPGQVREIADLVRTHQEIPGGGVAPEPGTVPMGQTPEGLPRRLVGTTPEPNAFPREPGVPRATMGETPEPGTVDLPTRRLPMAGRMGGVERTQGFVPPKKVGGPPARTFTPPEHVTAMDDVERFVRRGQPVPGETADAARREVGQALGAVPETAVDRVRKALKVAPRIIKRQSEQYTLERGQRIAQARGVRPKGTGGEAGFRRQLSKMSGEMTRLDFESLRPLIGQQDVDQLFNMVDASPFLDEFEKLSAQRGLRKLFGEAGGQVPAQDELTKLQTVFGKEFVADIIDKKPLLDRLMGMTAKTLGGWRSVVTSYDLSAPLNQGLFLGAGNPKEFTRSFFQMFRYAGSEKAFKALEQDIMNRPTFLLMKRSKLGLTDMGSILSGREEAFISDWAEKIPGVRQSNRAYVGFLNKMRADVFDKLVREAQAAGKDPFKDLVYTRQIADFINDATGRGRLGKIGSIDLSRHADLLNAGFFSPRLIASRVRLMNPGLYVHQNQVVRKQALRSLIGMTGAGLAVLSLAKAAGADVELNPKSPDFAKARFGNTRFDVFGGFTQYARMFANILPFAGGPDSGTRLDYLSRFAQQKASPAAGLALDLLRGKDWKGEDIATPQYVAEKFVPLLMQDLYDLYNDGGMQNVMMGLPALFGVRIQTYE